MKIYSIALFAATALWTRLGDMKNDDKVINEEGVASLTNSIPATVTNTVRGVLGTVKDEKTEIIWKQVMYDGNLYYVAVTNMPVEVAE